MRTAPGCNSCNNPSCFAPSNAVTKVIPVTLLPGRLRLATRPSLTGSPPVTKTIGIVVVAALATIAEGTSCAAITVTWRTRSAARSGSRSYWSCAQRYSIADVAGFTNALPECGQITCTISKRRAAEETDHRHRRLLRACRERPSRRAAEKCDEVAALQLIELHSIPSQGRIAEYRIGRG